MLLHRKRLHQLKPSPYNPREELKPGDPEYEKLRKSIQEFGIVEPVVWNKRTEHVVGGHQRVKVMADLGFDVVEVVVVDLPLEREKQLNLALNKISGDWDQEKLAALLDELIQNPELDLDLTGFDLPEAQNLIDQILEPSDESQTENFDFAAELEAGGPIVTRQGELIELGDHRLLCGDSTDPKQVRQIMDGERAILFATDPPYQVGYDGLNHPGSGKKRNKDWSGSYAVTWDDNKFDPLFYENFIRAAVDHAISNRAAWYCWHASRRQAMLEEVWRKFGAFVHQQLIWAKDRPVLTRSWYSWQHEPCFFGWRKGRKPPIVSRQPLSSVWQIPTVAPGQSTEHPTSKPIELFAIPLRQHTVRGDICYEPFCGSGSQLIAAERLQRRCFAIEISPRYCDVIVRRWIACVGSKAPPKLVRRYRREQAVAA